MYMFMNRQAAINILKNPKSSKAKLREALAFALGVEYVQENTTERKQGVFTRCMKEFCDAYQNYSGLPYVFSPKDGKALKELIEKVKMIGSPNCTSDETVVSTFVMLILKLPEWYKKNNFSLPVVNSKFNEIIASIKQNGNEQSGISNDYKNRVAERIRARSTKRDTGQCTEPK